MNWLEENMNSIVLGDSYELIKKIPVVAKQEGYKYIGIERNKEFYEKSLKRLNGITASGQTSIFTDFEEVANED